MAGKPSETTPPIPWNRSLTRSAFCLVVSKYLLPLIGPSKTTYWPPSSQGAPGGRRHASEPGEGPLEIMLQLSRQDPHTELELLIVVAKTKKERLHHIPDPERIYPTASDTAMSKGPPSARRKARSDLLPGTIKAEM